MKDVKVFFLMAILGISITIFGQEAIERSPHLSQNSNLFMKNVPIALKNAASKFHPDGTIEFKSEVNLSKNEILSFMNLPQDCSFEAKRARKSRFDQNVEYQFHQQYYNGILVSGGGFTLKINSQNKILQFSPNIYENIEVNTTPSVLDSDIKRALNVDTVYSKELVILDKGAYILAWRVFYTLGMTSMHALINAHTNEILSNNYLNPNINGTTHTYGVKNMNDFTQNGQTSMQTPNGQIRIYEFIPQKRQSVDPNEWLENYIPTTNSTQTWDNNSTTNSRQAFYAANQVVPKFNNMGVNFGTVNIATNAIKRALAFFGSTVNEAYIELGEVEGVPLGLFDVVAHELGHCFLFQFLNYTNEFTNAALHEGISDIIGCYIENFILPNGTDWIMGGEEEVVALETDRNLSDDACENNLLFVGQHERGRVIGHWFYNIVVGNPDSNIPALGMQQSMDILVEALNNLNNTEAGFLHMREQTLLVAETNFGVCSQQYEAILKAWDYVCVEGTFETCPCNTYGKPKLNANSAIINCSASSINLNQFITSTTPQGALLIWSTDNDPSDGVNPILSSLVSTSGTYYAFYQNTIENCFTKPSSAIVVTSQSLQADIIIDKDTYITGSNFYGGNIIVNNGVTLHVHLANLSFLQGKGVIVKNGGRLILQGTTIDVCDPTLSWAGIKIESGGFFDTDDTYLYNVANGIDAKSNSTLQIYNLTIDGKSSSTGIGINLDGKVNDDFINTINISNLKYGVYAHDGNSYYGITSGRITNVQYGVFLLSSPTVVSGLYMHNVDYGIWSMSSPGSMFLGNEIYLYNSGILSYLSQNTLIDGNIISQPKTTGNVGVLMFLSPQSNIQDNTHIEGKTIGVSSWASSGAIARNSIEVIGNNNSSGGGIVNLFSSGNQIIDNYVNANNSSFGIESNSSNDIEIKNNQTSVFSNTAQLRSAAIRSTGSTGEIIEDNRAEGVGNATGILIQNAGMNTIKCNDVISPDEALGIYIASDEQGIIGNELTGAQDLTIRSVVGIQNHEGNKFYGGNATAFGLTNNDLDNSKFYVNGSIPYHMPANPDPSGDQWFKSKAQSDYQCSGTAGPGWVPFKGGNPNEICKYWLHIKSIRNSKPELFFVKLYHLLKYAKSRPNFTIPNCVKLDPLFQSLCGLTKLVDINEALLSIGKNSVNTSNLETYQQNYLIQSSEQEKLATINQLKVEMESIKPQFDANAVNNNSRLDSLKNELNLINCTEVIVQKWKGILKLYVDFLKAREVSQENRAATLAYSSECSDTYGDMIHLARAMANTFDQANFEAYDNCFNGSTPRTSKVDSETIKLQVYPNPSSGLVNIKMSASFTGQIFVKTLDGKLLQSKTVKNSYIDEIDLSHKAGVYFVELIDINGYKTTQKVIILE